MTAYICKTCGTVGKPKTKNSGTFMGEVVAWVAAIAIANATMAWILLILPLGYSIYRVSTKASCCAKCDSSDVIPVDTPQGQMIKKQNAME
jgi:hypothetical protein